MLTTNSRTKIVILSDDREIHITEAQYNAIKGDQAIGKYSDPIVIRDPDTKQILFDGKIGAIKEFRDINKGSYSGLVFICDYGIRHPVHLSCECMNQYKVSPIVFRTSVRSVYPQVRYPRDITPEMRNRVLSSLR